MKETLTSLLYPYIKDSNIYINPDITLEAATLSHARALYKNMDKDREYLSRFLDWAAGQTLSSLEGFLAAQLARQQQGVEQGYVIKYHDEIAGMITLFHINPRSFGKPGMAEIGYYLFERFQGKGIMRETVLGLTSVYYVEHGINRFVFVIMPDNMKSLNVVKAIGAQYEGVLRQYKGRDEVVQYSYVLPDDFIAHNNTVDNNLRSGLKLEPFDPSQVGASSKPTGTNITVTESSNVEFIQKDANLSPIDQTVPSEQEALAHLYTHQPIAQEHGVHATTTTSTITDDQDTNKPVATTPSTDDTDPDFYYELETTDELSATHDHPDSDQQALENYFTTEARAFTDLGRQQPLDTTPAETEYVEAGKPQQDANTTTQELLAKMNHPTVTKPASKMVDLEADGIDPTQAFTQNPEFINQFEQQAVAATETVTSEASMTKQPTHKVPDADLDTDKDPRDFRGYGDALTEAENKYDFEKHNTYIDEKSVEFQQELAEQEAKDAATAEVEPLVPTPDDQALPPISADEEFPLNSYDKLAYLARKLHADDALSPHEVSLLEHPAAEKHFEPSAYQKLKQKLVEFRNRHHKD